MIAELQCKETWLHRTNPSGKLLLSVALFFLVLFTHNLNVLVNATWMLFVLLIAASGHPGRRIALLGLPFALMFLSSAMSMILFGRGDTLWFRWGLVAVSEESFYRGIHIGLKTVDTGIVGMLFALTTRPVSLFYSLMQQLKLPPRYAYSFMAALRLLPMVAAEYRTLEMALKVRGVRPRRGIAGFSDRLRRYSVPLLAQSIRRAQRIAVAMEAKRFSAARQRTYYYTVSWSANDLLLVAALSLIWLVSMYIGNQFPFFDVTDVRYVS
ncbi:energy-coupling factor transporter transmembrane component T family protein [Paenibacillus ginsengihumi]|uniref:energy-coupling factor transporter transmembrane component T family protein n=1 Tax=Paenibacillus ginsengihumi TaxID=431596 RepID=UPI00037469C6|nr:energy-coupling factor transporter transmembrane component T [Paenibacillus ginsengihumi]